MTAQKKHSGLFSEFPAVSANEWEGKINGDLKGADYEKKLHWKPSDGLDLKPYYRLESLDAIKYLDTLPGQYPYTRGDQRPDNNWIIRQNIGETDPARANECALKAIAAGAESIEFNVSEITDEKDIQLLLNNIDLLKTTIYFSEAVSFVSFHSLFYNEVIKRKNDPTIIRGGYNYSPLNYFLQYGKFKGTVSENISEGTKLLKLVRSQLPLFEAITVFGHKLHNAGASIIQELALTISMGSEYLNLLGEHGLSTDEICRHVRFVFSSGSNYFLEIAKLRAARVLWTKVVEQYKPSSDQSYRMHVHIETSNANKTVYDAYVNMLRSTTETLSAAIGGCDSISVTPFDNAFKKPDDFSERIARNTQLLLKHESYIDKVIDPAAGSYYIENLTHSLIETSWNWFLRLEEKGGFLKTVECGYVIEEIEKTCQQRDMDIAMRKQIILGTNQYPNLQEQMLDKLEPNSATESLGVLKPYRGAKAFEAIRFSTEDYIRKGHKRPSVFMLTFGNPAMRKARATFAANFFGCAGYNIIDNTGFKTADDGIVAALKSNAEFIVFCSADDEYEQNVSQACGKLKSENPDLCLIVAGNPTEIAEKLKQSGVDDFIHMRSNLVVSLLRYQRMLGIV